MTSSRQSGPLVASTLAPQSQHELARRDLVMGLVQAWSTCFSGLEVCPLSGTEYRALADNQRGVPSVPDQEVPIIHRSVTYVSRVPDSRVGLAHLCCRQPMNAQQMCRKPKSPPRPQRNCRIDTLLLDAEYVLASAAREGNLDQVQRLLDLGANHSPRDLADGTPLMGAAREGHEPIVSLLLQQGASVFDRDRANRTTLHWAAERGHVEVAEELLDNGADLSAVDRKGSTPLHLGAANRFPAMVSLLLERGASTSAKDGDAKTPLHVAAEVGVTKTVMIIIQKGADVLSVDEQGRTPLHCAV
ncbi:hypothetical protein ASPCAL14498 [Aspergillus calidoustus]|uniref:Uncharacterized protein n=1 Tax=Aspergillus calidoustus TaxID=454130 RepID=A0A0U5HB19_ASPCI|nr:hypothetical protein ASPCAL14498 [Aspergillus calidoustus]